jgi:hypothetical protein
MEFYLMAVAIGVGLALIWLGWLLAVRTLIRATRSAPGAIISVIQVAVVLLLMLAGYHVTDSCFTRLRISAADAPAALVTFRRIWILIWGLGMVASIQVFLDIRRMSTPPASSPRRR